MEVLIVSYEKLVKRLVQEKVLSLQLNHFKSMLYFSLPPENVREPLVF